MTYKLFFYCSTVRLNKFAKAKQTYLLNKSLSTSKIILTDKSDIMYRTYTGLCNNPVNTVLYYSGYTVIHYTVLEFGFEDWEACFNRNLY